MIFTSPTLIRILTGAFARAITIWPVIVVKEKELCEDACLINHEKIHLRQQGEMLILPFYLWYGIEYLWYRLSGKDHYRAYMSISFEKEAFHNESNLEYLNTRPLWAFWNYTK